MMKISIGLDIATVRIGPLLIVVSKYATLLVGMTEMCEFCAKWIQLGESVMHLA